jgi:hypothetical protein
MLLSALMKDGDANWWKTSCNKINFKGFQVLDKKEVKKTSLKKVLNKSAHFFNPGFVLTQVSISNFESFMSLAVSYIEEIDFLKK